MTGAGGSSISISSFSGGSISIINGRVFIDGVEQKPNGGTQSKTPRREPRIRIESPAANLDAQMSGESFLVSQQALNTVEIALSGESKASLSAMNLEASVSGQSRLDAQVSGGSLRLDISGQSAGDVAGTWTQARIDVSGMSRVHTKWQCTGRLPCRIFRHVAHHSSRPGQWSRPEE